MEKITQIKAEIAKIEQDEDLINLQEMRKNIDNLIAVKQQKVKDLQSDLTNATAEYNEIRYQELITIPQAFDNAIPDMVKSITFLSTALLARGSGDYDHSVAYSLCEKIGARHDAVELFTHLFSALQAADKFTIIRTYYTFAGYIVEIGKSFETIRHLIDNGYVTREEMIRMLMGHKLTCGQAAYLYAGTERESNLAVTIY